MSTSLQNLPDIDNARLPVSYENAKNALAQCTRIDECQDWADKAEAMASYARMANDDQLRKMADRIQARAIRRCGELLKQIAPATGNNLPNVERDGAVPYGRIEAATAAGLSERQRKTALRVANVPEDEFYEAVESDDPPTVTELAKAGTKKNIVDLRGVNPKHYKMATEAQGMLKLFSEFARANNPLITAGGFHDHEIDDAKQRVSDIDSWLDRFVTSLGD